MLVIIVNTEIKLLDFWGQLGQSIRAISPSFARKLIEVEGKDPNGSIVMRLNHFQSEWFNKANDQYLLGLGIQYPVKITSLATTVPNACGGILIVGASDKPTIDLYQFDCFEVRKDWSASTKES